MKTRRFLLIGGILLVIAVAYPIVRHYQLRAAAQSYIAELKAKGEPMELAQVVPPPIPPDQNGADTFRKVAALFKADQSLIRTNSYSCMKMVAPGKAIVCSREPFAADYDTTNSWEEVARAVAQNKESFDLLQQLVDRPNLDFRISYEKGADLDFAYLYLPELKRSALRLESATLSDLHRGDSESAVKHLRAILAIVKGTRDECLVISELVRIAIVHIAFAANWEVLQSTNVTDRQFATLQHDWANIEFVGAEEKALEVERMTQEITLRNWRRSGAKLRRSFDTWSEISSNNTIFARLKFESRIARWQYWWSYPDEVLTLEGYQTLLDASRFEKTNSSWLLTRKQLTNNLAKLMIPTNSDGYWGDPYDEDMRFMFSSSISLTSHYLNRAVATEAAKQLALAAIALKRYQLKHEKYPPDLNTLVPEFVSTVPNDPMDGKPLRYQLNSDGTFLLYSIGDDGKDDSGNPTPLGSSKSLWWLNGRDWVWPQPATAEEIQNYYKNLPK